MASNNAVICCTQPRTGELIYFTNLSLLDEVSLDEELLGLFARVRSCDLVFFSSIMGPLTALGLVGNIIQVIDFSS